MNGKQKWKDNYIRCKRYIVYLLQYLFYEKPRGLDFTMKDTRIFKESNGKYHSYSKTNEKHLREIFKTLDYEKELYFLDVGSGKGVALKEAVKFPFKEVAGIELQPEMLKIAEKNFKILGIEKKLNNRQADAVSFEDYGRYNVFFFFNPFSEEILSKVADRLSESMEEKEKVITVIYHDPRFLHLFEEKMQVITKRWMYDSLKNYQTCILELKKA